MCFHAVCLIVAFCSGFSDYKLCVFLPSVLEKSEFKDESQFFRFYADEEMEGTGTKSKQLQRNDFKLIENILAKSLVVSWSTNKHMITRISTFSHALTWLHRYLLSRCQTHIEGLDLFVDRKT